MLVDAQAHPGPAMWQGYMFLVLAVWALWLYSGDRTTKQMKLSWIVLFFMSILPFLVIGLIKLMGS